jgi:small subunit ribosomal protein S5
MLRVPLKDGRTLHHESMGRHGAGKVIVRPADQGTGIIAGGPMRAVFESLGVGDVVAKSLGTSNPYNMVRATFDALKQQQSPRHIAQRRGKSVQEIVQKRGAQGKEKAEAAAGA